MAAASVAGYATPGISGVFGWSGQGASAAQPTRQPIQIGVAWDRTVGRNHLGAPYQADGVWFIPAAQPRYNEIGLAAPYSAAREGVATAAGEAFDADAITAAHATLPLPSMVEVTNLETGRTLRIRLNDRGGTKPGRVIDLSPAAAQALGVPMTGAKVRVRYIGPAPLDRNAAAPAQIAAAAPAIRSVKPVRMASAKPAPRAAVPQLVPTVEAGGYGVQAGAFADRNNAEKVALALSAAGRTAIRPLDRDGVRLYRVVVGQWRDPASASAALSRVAELGFAGARVVSF
ncbi:MAG: septal ring lytic transglycosylase RlpA family protein [Caulobacteraceae bacterium]